MQHGRIPDPYFADPDDRDPDPNWCNTNCFGCLIPSNGDTSSLSFGGRCAHRILPCHKLARSNWYVWLKGADGIADIVLYDLCPDDEPLGSLQGFPGAIGVSEESARIHLVGYISGT
jgi:hypothetical protein